MFIRAPYDPQNQPDSWNTSILGSLSIRTLLYFHTCTMLKWTNIPPLFVISKSYDFFPLNCKTCTCFNFYHKIICIDIEWKMSNESWIETKGTQFKLTRHLKYASHLDWGVVWGSNEHFKVSEGTNQKSKIRWNFLGTSIRFMSRQCSNLIAL
jgi:hypothetical protein